MEKILLAESCIEVYENIEEFLEKSGWRRDNPELCSECYLFENHICRKIQGKIWYFSRIQYENAAGHRSREINRGGNGAGI